MELPSTLAGNYLIIGCNIISAQLSSTRTRMQSIACQCSDAAADARLLPLLGNLIYFSRILKLKMKNPVSHGGGGGGGNGGYTAMIMSTAMMTNTQTQRVMVVEINELSRRIHPLAPTLAAVMAMMTARSRAQTIVVDYRHDHGCGSSLLNHNGRR